MAANRLHILLLEDDQTLAQVLARAMQKRGHSLDWACDEEAFRTAFDSGMAYDLVLMDLKLEAGSSLGWIARVRQCQPQAKIIMMTGYASIATTVEAMKQGADDYLPKPVTADDILRVYHGDRPDAGVTEEVLSPRRLEWEHIQRVLHENAGNISKTAEQLNMHRRTLQRKLQKKPQL